MARRRHFDDACLDPWQVETGWHPVVEQPAVTQDAFFVVKVLFVQCPPDALRGASLHLTFDIARMDSSSDILCNGCTQDIHFSGIRIDLDVYCASGEGWAHASCVDRCATRNWTTGSRQAPGHFFNGHGLDAITLGAELAIVEGDFLGLLLPQFCGAFLELAYHVLGGFVCCPSRGERRTAAAGHIGMPDRIRVGDKRTHIISIKAQHLRGDHCLCGSGSTNIDGADYDTRGPISVDIDDR